MQSSGNDEDWSIISSSSDMEEENSSNLPVESEDAVEDQIISSVATLKLPCLASCHLKLGNLPDGKKLEVEEKEGYRVRKKSDKPDSQVYCAIRFYESLSTKFKEWNESIKVRSQNFHQSIAKTKLERLNTFVQLKRSKETHEEIESQCEGDGETKVMNKESSFRVGRYIKAPFSYDNMSNCINGFSEFLDDNSQYLFYYVIAMVTALISICGLYFKWDVKMKISQPPPSSRILMTRKVKAYGMEASEQIKEFFDSIVFENTRKSRYFGLFKDSSPRRIRIAILYERWRDLLLNTTQTTILNASRSSKRLVDIATLKSDLLVTMLKLNLKEIKHGVDKGARQIYYVTSPVREYVVNAIKDRSINCG